MKIINLLSVLIIAFLLIGAAAYYFTKHRSAQTATGMQRTFAIIKPDAVAAGNAEDIIKQIEMNGFKILDQKQLIIDKETAEKFYAVHKDRPFFNDLITYITSGPATVLVLERDNAVQVWRNLMGATDPKKADPGTVRNLYGTDIQHNAVHGSDSVENAKKEIAIFFPDLK